MPGLSEFPLVTFHIKDPENLYGTMEWQKTGAKYMIHHYLNFEAVLSATLDQCRYFQIPIGTVICNRGL